MDIITLNVNEHAINLYYENTIQIFDKFKRGWIEYKLPRKALDLEVTITNYVVIKMEDGRELHINCTDDNLVGDIFKDSEFVESFMNTDFLR